MKEGAIVQALDYVHASIGNVEHFSRLMVELNFPGPYRASFGFAKN
jgi:hypothetical protein